MHIRLTPLFYLVPAASAKLTMLDAVLTRMGGEWMMDHWRRLERGIDELLSVRRFDARAFDVHGGNVRNKRHP